MSRMVSDPLEQAANNAAYDGLERIALAHPSWTRHMAAWLHGELSDQDFWAWFREYEQNPDKFERRCHE